MSKPQLLNRLKNKTDLVTSGNLLQYSDTTGRLVEDTGLNAQQIKVATLNNANIVSHLANDGIHVTREEKKFITQDHTDLNNHLVDASSHISPTDRANWDAKETPEGAQAKVNMAAASFNRHMATKSIHVSNSDRLSWDDKYTKAEIDNKFVQLESNNTWKEAVDTFSEIDIMYPSPQRGWTVSVNDTNITFRYDGENWIPISSNAVPMATAAVDGLMSKEDKAKLDTVEMGANNYVHPNNPSTRHVSDKEKAFWSAKAEDRNATYQYAGLMSKEDKYKLDNIETGATNFSMPSKLDPTIIETDNDHLFVTLEEKTNWSNKASNNLVTPNVNGIMSKEDKIKLNSVDMNANYYIHPQTHDPSIILEDASHRFVTDEQILAWNNKLDGSLATAESNGGMSKEDKAKLDSIEEGANKYKLPAQLPPTIIAQDPNNRFFTDQERQSLADKKDSKSILLGTAEFNGRTGTIIPHSFENTSFSVAITPTANPNGLIGEVWVKKTNTACIVYCSGAGDAKIPFDYMLIYYN